MLEADPTKAVEWHRHRTAHVVFVLNGLYLSSADGPTPIHTAGALIYNPPSTVHRDRFESVGGRIAGRFLAISMADDAEPAGVVLPAAAAVIDHPGAIAAAWWLADRCLSATGIESRSVEQSVQSLLAAIGSAPRRSPVPGWLEQARVLLVDHCHERLGVAAVAQALGVHRVYLARAFRTAFGVAPGEYHRHLRVRRAATLLRSTRMALPDIAARCGFSDQSHLNRVFKQRLGVAPGRYRARRGAGSDPSAR